MLLSNSIIIFFTILLNWFIDLSGFKCAKPTGFQWCYDISDNHGNIPRLFSCSVGSKFGTTTSLYKVDVTVFSWECYKTFW
ncbi:hypothetical protein LWI28_029234 [Acer negundo]|uniref:Uncharacterized protein n=1 Tax=Acer negundo TaxID=4023 RepID=A0AAD5NGE6_ACENE|nr:hypothetical protein LWI28_029234 [Acer negundo]